MDFFDSKEQREREREVERREQTARAKQYVTDEKITCDSSLDLDALKLVVDAFEKNADIYTTRNFGIDNHDALFSELADEIKSADVNAFRFLKAIIYQNFMLMRKIDALSERIEKLEQ